MAYKHHPKEAQILASNLQVASRAPTVKRAVQLQFPAHMN